MSLNYITINVILPPANWPTRF